MAEPAKTRPTASTPSAERHTQATERIGRIREAVLCAPRSICLERPRLLARFRRSQEGRAVRHEHPLVRRAMALRYLMAHRGPRLYDDELIAGNMTSKRVAGNYYPEGGSVNLLEDLPRLEQRTVPLHLTAREKAELAWLGVTGMTQAIGARALLRPGRARHFFDFFRARRYFVTEEAGIAHQVLDYDAVIHRGMRAPDELAARCLDEDRRPDGTALGPDARAFYRGVRIAIEGVRAMASNLADALESRAANPAAPAERRTELRAMAEHCRRVPYEPSRTLWEGLQACWLVHLALNLEDFEQGLSFGRLDRFLISLYHADIEAGRLTPVRATEILASFCLKTCETMPLYSERIDEYFSGLGVAQGITLGGTDEQGRDTTNELSGLILDAYAQVLTREPALHARVHPNTPAWFLERCVALVQLGTSKPSFFGDAAVVPALCEAGMTEEHARDYAVIGCVELASQGRTYNSSDAALFNLALPLELALHEGRPFARGPCVGAAIPPAAQLRSFDAVLTAYRVQVVDAVDDMVRVMGWLEETYRTHRPTPINSMFTDGCLASGRDVTWGGARYDLTSIQGVGVAEVGDSLYALDRLVFREGRMSLTALVDVLRADYRGHEPLQAELRNRFPRFGNGDSEVDRYTQIAADIFTDVITARRNTRGGRYVPGFYTMTCHLGFGRRTGALPDGRPAGARLSNGLAPVDGVERQGPTAVLRSAAALDSHRWTNGYALNLKFDARAVGGVAGRRALTALLRQFFSDGGLQVQVNVLDAAELRAAKEDPDAHRGIVVRVAGYCAYFTDLHPEVQDEIIERTAHGMG
ncbi:MAG: hypothetical protein DRI90_02355 [Deltaproteobacteria bacterium]|nr:MAG: hypothetical protein DRI90_02355 [Deltaproteobacteria bacterium]